MFQFASIRLFALAALLTTSAACASGPSGDAADYSIDHSAASTAPVSDPGT